MLTALRRQVGDMKVGIPVAMSQDHLPMLVNDEETGAIVEVVKPQLKQPRRYQVVMMNDDYTPMDFVVEVLERFFSLGEEQATQVMLQIHHYGKAGIGSYTLDVAETKAAMVVEYARQHEHPLLCQVEPAS